MSKRGKLCGGPEWATRRRSVPTRPKEKPRPVARARFKKPLPGWRLPRRFAAAPTSSNNSANLELGLASAQLRGSWIDLPRPAAFGFFNRACHVQLIFNRDFRVQLHRDGVEPRSLIGRSSTIWPRFTVKPASVASFRRIARGDEP